MAENDTTSERNRRDIFMVEREGEKVPLFCSKINLGGDMDAIPKKAQKANNLPDWANYGLELTVPMAKALKSILHPPRKAGTGPEKF
jgi:hypothetical protein